MKYFLFLISVYCAFSLDLANLKIFPLKRGGEGTFSIENNKKFAFQLRSNPTTGYNWYVTNLEEVAKTNLVEFKNLDENGTGEYVANHVEKRIVGGNGNTYFILQSNESNQGEVELKFVYKRVWMADENDQTINVILKVGS